MAERVKGLDNNLVQVHSWCEKVQDVWHKPKVILMKYDVFCVIEFQVDPMFVFVLTNLYQVPKSA